MQPSRHFGRSLASFFVPVLVYTALPAGKDDLWMNRGFLARINIQRDENGA
jgi:hypothetical protein